MRYTYLCNERPPFNGSIPKDGLICCESNGIGRYGECVYTRALSTQEVKKYELTPYCSEVFMYATAQSVANEICNNLKASLNNSSDHPFIEYIIRFDDKGDFGQDQNVYKLAINYPVNLYTEFLNRQRDQNMELIMDKFRKIECKFAHTNNPEFLKICKEIAQEINVRLDEFWN